MELTVVICTHNRVDLLRSTVGHLDAAVRPPGMVIKLLIVANACSDGSREWLQRRVQCQDGEALVTTWLEEPKPGKSRALNLAIANLETAWAAFVDDDQRVAVDFFQATAAALRAQPEVRFFCGRLLPDWTGGEPSWARDDGPFRIYPPPITSYDLGDEPLVVSAGTEIPAGGDLIVHRKIFEDIGDFDTELGPKGHDLVGSEDTEFVLRALAAGEVIRYVPTIVQFHYVDMARLRIGYLMRKAYQRSRSITRSEFQGRRSVPRYFWRKLAGYMVRTVLSTSVAKTRFYLVRLAATWGEMRGMLDSN